MSEEWRFLTFTVRCSSSHEGLDCYYVNVFCSDSECCCIRSTHFTKRKLDQNRILLKETTQSHLCFEPNPWRIVISFVNVFWRVETLPAHPGSMQVLVPVNGPMHIRSTPGVPLCLHSLFFVCDPGPHVVAEEQGAQSDHSSQSTGHKTQCRKSIANNSLPSSILWSLHRNCEARNNIFQLLRTKCPFGPCFITSNLIVLNGVLPWLPIVPWLTLFTKKLALHNSLVNFHAWIDIPEVGHSDADLCKPNHFRVNEGDKLLEELTPRILLVLE